MIIDQSEKSVFGKYSSFIRGSCSEKLNILIDARSVDTVELRILANKRIKELNQLVGKIDKLEMEISK